MGTIHALLHTGTTALTHYLNNSVSGRQEALWLLMHVLGISQTKLLTSTQRTLTPDEYSRYTDLIHQRIALNTPLAYLIGTVPFCGLTLSIQPPILIPRHETEELVSELIEKLKLHQGPLKILDMCTGSGCIALALAFHLPNATVTGCDIDPQALALAIKNKNDLGLSNVTFRESDIFTNLTGQTFDLIISNPPYLTPAEWQQLDADVKNWEAPHALVGGASGLAYYEAIISQAARYLSGVLRQSALPELVLEYGYTQAEALSNILAKHAFQPPILKRDSFNHCRALWAHRI
jgi:release factor glutamine methyltransferase